MVVWRLHTLIYLICNNKPYTSSYIVAVVYAAASMERKYRRSSQYPAYTVNGDGKSTKNHHTQTQITRYIIYRYIRKYTEKIYIYKYRLNPVNGIR